MKPPSGLYIDGVWTPPAVERSEPSIDPSTGTAWIDVAWGGKDDVAAAVEAAERARYGPWAALSPTARGRLLERVATIIRRDVDQIAEVETRDNGKPLSDTQREVLAAATWFEYFGGFADKVGGATIPYDGSDLALTLREPVGVVAAITPWNAPFLMTSWKVSAALAMGNTMVLKPSELTSVSALYLMSALAEAELPAGVVNLVTGDGAEVGAALVSDPRISLVSFTGSIETARVVSRLASESLTPCILECGGKSPNIVFADADLEVAARAATRAAFKSSGQSCSVGSRLFVQDSIYEQFVDTVVSASSALRLARPLTQAPDILGPQTSSDQRDKTLRYIGIGRREGQVRLGGDVPDDEELRDGYYVRPTIVDSLDHDSELAQEEVFGPVLTAFSFESDEEVLDLANRTRYGLVGAVWTSDVSRAMRFVKGIDAGFVSVNTYRPQSPLLPYGGRKLSGYGKENGREALDHYSTRKTVVIHHG